MGGRVCICAGVKYREGKRAEPSYPIVGKKIIPKTEKFSSRNRSVLFSDMELNNKNQLKEGKSGFLCEGGMGGGSKVEISVFRKLDSSIYVYE